MTIGEEDTTFAGGSLIVRNVSMTWTMERAFHGGAGTHGQAGRHRIGRFRQANLSA